MCIRDRTRSLRPGSEACCGPAGFRATRIAASWNQPCHEKARLGSTSDPGNHWSAIPAVLLGPDCGDEPLIHVLDGATGESWHQRYDGSCAPPGLSLIHISEPTR